MRRSPHARGAGAIPPTSGEAPAGDTAQGFRGQGSTSGPDSQAARLAGQALRVIDGEGYATAYLQRLHDGTARPGELAMILAFLDDGDMLRGACRVIEKALEDRYA